MAFNNYHLDRCLNVDFIKFIIKKAGIETLVEES